MEIPEMDDAVKTELRDSLILLANRGKIKYTERFLRRAGLKQLEKIKSEYDRQQTEIVDEQISGYVISAISSVLKNLEYVDEAECEEMKKTLLDNDLVKKDLSDLSGYITSNIKYIGLATLVVVAGGYVFKTYRKSEEEKNKDDGKQTEQKEQKE